MLLAADGSQPKFHFDMNFEEDGKQRKARAYFEDPETGEKTWVEIDPEKYIKRELPLHCCLPPTKK